MSEQTDIRTEFAALLTDAIGAPVAAFIPATLRTASGYLQHGQPYMDTTGPNATFQRPELRLELVLIAPAVDWDRAMTWIDDKVNLIRGWLTANPTATVAGHRRPAFTTVTAVGVADGKAIAFAVAFTPVQMRSLS